MMDNEQLPKGYKNTEVGVIPEDWEVKEFQDVMEGFSSGQTPYRGRPEFYKGDIPWITSGELNYNIITDTIEHITIEGAREANLKSIPKGTFLFAITGLEAAGTRGSCAITGIEATTNQSCMALYPKKGLLITPYLYHFYVRYGNELAFKYCQGTKQQSFTGGIAKKLPIIVPPTIEEQTAIATALSDADALINSLEKLIAKKRNIKQGAMQQLLKPNPDSYREDWEVKKFSEIFIKYPAKKYQLNSNEYEDTGLYPIIDQGKKLIVGYSDNQEKLFRCPINGIIVFGDHTRILKYIDFNFIVGADGTQLLSVQDEYSTLFIYYLLLTKEIPNTGYNRHFKFLLELEFTIPSTKEEQTRIATILSDMDAEIQALETKLEKYRKIKLGMMQNLLTGKIRLI
jgi:type I restriction enzyme S subunit